MSKSTHSFEFTFKMYDQASKTFKTMMGQIEGNYKNTEKNLKKTAQSLKDNFVNSTKAVVSQLSTVGFDRAIGMVEECIETTEKYETALAKLSTMADSTQVNMSNFWEEVKDKSVEYGRDITEVVDSVFNIISATTDTAGSLSLFDWSSKLALGGQANIPATSNLLTTLLASYGENYSIDELSDIITQMQVRGKTDMSQLASSLPQVIPFAYSAGMSLEDLGTAMSTITGNGLDTAMATVALKNAINSILSPTASAKKEFEELGIVTGSKAFSSMDFLTYLENLRDAIGLSEEATEQLKNLMSQADTTDEELKNFFNSSKAKINTDTLLEMFGNMRGATAMMSLLNDIKDYKTHRETFNKENYSGLTQQKFDTMYNTTSERKKRLEQDFERVKADFGEQLLPFQEELLSFAETGLNAWKQLDDSQQKTLANLLIKFTLLTGAIRGANFVIGTFTPIVTALKDGCLLLKPAITKLTTAIGSVLQKNGLSGSLRTGGAIGSVLPKNGLLGSLRIGGALGVIGWASSIANDWGLNKEEIKKEDQYKYGHTNDPLEKQKIIDKIEEEDTGKLSESNQAIADYKSGKIRESNMTDREKIILQGAGLLGNNTTFNIQNANISGVEDVGDFVSKFGKVAANVAG